MSDEKLPQDPYMNWIVVIALLITMIYPPLVMIIFLAFVLWASLSNGSSPPRL